MAKNQSVFFTQALTTMGVTFSSNNGVGDVLGTNSIQIAVGAANDSRLVLCNITSNDTSAHDFYFYVNTGTASFLLTTVSIPASSGFVSGTLPISILNPSIIPNISADNNGNYYLRIKSGYSLYAAPASSISSGKVITIITKTEDY